MSVLWRSAQYFQWSLLSVVIWQVGTLQHLLSQSRVSSDNAFGPNCVIVPSYWNSVGPGRHVAWKHNPDIHSCQDWLIDSVDLMLLHSTWSYPYQDSTGMNTLRETPCNEWSRQKWGISIEDLSCGHLEFEQPWGAGLKWGYRTTYALFMQVVLIRLFGLITRQAKGNIVVIAFQTVFVRTKGKIHATPYHAVHCSPAFTQPFA